MIFGMPLFTLFHVLLSVVGIASGLIVLGGLLSSNVGRGWESTFLLTTAATSLTGFLFPFHGVTPAIILGVVSLVALAAACAGRYLLRLAGAGRWLYVIGSVLALYLNSFVLVVQAFVKLPALHALAPTTPPSGPVFSVVQGLVMLTFVVAGVLAVRRFRARA